MSNYSNYEASELVKSTHNLPHLNERLQTTNSNFDIGYDDTNLMKNGYFQSLLPISIIVGVISILALLFLQCGLTCRLCYRGCKLKGVFKKCGAIPLIVLLVIAFIPLQLQIWGNLQSQSGMSTLINSLDSLQSTFDSLSSDGTTLVNQGNIVLSDFQQANTASCNTQSLINTLNSGYFPYVNSFSDGVSPLSDNCGKGSDNLSDYGQYVRKEVMWLFYSVQMTIVIIFSVGLVCKSKVILTIAISVTELSLLTVFSAGAVLLVVLMLLADFCMDPTSNILLTMNPSSSYYSTVSYYTTCDGSNPLTQYLNSAQSTINSLLSTVQNSYLNSASCSSVKSALTASVNEMNAILSTINGVYPVTTCSPIQDQITQGLQDGLCTTFFRGVYVVWLSQYCTAFFFFIAIILASILYQYYSPRRGINPDEPSAPEAVDDDVAIFNPVGDQSLLATQAAAEGNRRAAQRHWLFSTQPPPPQGARGRPSDFGFVEAQRLSLSSADRDSAPVADAVIFQL